MWHDFAAQRQNRLNVKAKDFLQLQLQPQAQAGRMMMIVSKSDDGVTSRFTGRPDVNLDKTCF